MESEKVREIREFIDEYEIRGYWSEEDVEYYYGNWIVKGMAKVLMYIVEGRVEDRDFKGLMYEARNYLRERGVKGIPFILGLRRVSR
ncbi:MAG: hypothetical protein KJ556_20325 [Gammaproteobacteria bacterium]|uniref:Uncharacterized protein n=1 Tax=viral metagenome TaxID=1070528 RepID=A0A6M3IIU1_9ZZZZ|nr:hypothetical protein [Gammaproteobacteria bacterium]